MEPRFQATHFGFQDGSTQKNWVEPWNHGTLVPGYTFEVPWFHGSTQFFLGGTMEPWNLGSRLHKKGSMVPWFQGGTMEPWNHGTQMCIMSIQTDVDAKA